MKQTVIILFVTINSFVYSQTEKYNKTYSFLIDISGIWNIYQTDSTYNCIGIRSYNNTYGIFTLKLSETGNTVHINNYIDTAYIYYSGFEKNTYLENNIIHQVITRKKSDSSLYEIQHLKYNSDLDTISTGILCSDTIAMDAFDCVYFDNYIYTIGTKCFTPLNTDNIDYILNKSNTNDSTIWIKNYGGTQADIAYQIINTYDNKLLISGLSFSYGAGSPYDNGQWLVIKTDTGGQTEWQKLYGNPNLLDGRPHSLIETKDTCYIITGSLAIEKPDAAERLRGRILKIDRTGNIIWDMLYGYKTPYTYASIIKEKVNKDLICIFNDGPTAVNGYDGIYNPFILALTPLGYIKWHRRYIFNNKPEVLVSVLNSFYFTPDDGYIFAGYGTDADSVPAQRSWVIKTDSLGFDGTYYQGDTTLGITLATDTVCYGDSAKLVFHLTGKSAPYAVQLSNGNSKNEIYYSPYFESYAYDSLYIYPADSNSYYNFSAIVTDPWGNTATESFAVWIRGCSTGIDEATIENEMIEVFPNPATTELHVKIRGLIEGTYTITMYDTQGKAVDIITTEEQETVIDISKYKQGVYWVRVLGNNIVRSEKVIKLNND